MPSYLDRISRGRPAPRVPQQPEAEPEFSWFDTAITTGLRVAPSIIGTVGGGLLGAAAGAPAAGVGAFPGAAVGAAAGGGAGGAFGEWLAQEYEKSRGVRDDYDAGSIAIEAGLGAIPLGKSATLLRAAAKGAGMGVAGSAAHQYYEEGEITPGRTGLAALLGGGFGAGGEAVARRFSGKVPPAAGAAERTADDTVDFVPDHGRFNRFAEHYVPPDDYAWRDQAPPRPSHLPPEMSMQPGEAPPTRPAGAPRRSRVPDEPEVEFEADAGPLQPRDADVAEYEAYVRRMQQIDDTFNPPRPDDPNAVDFVPDDASQLEPGFDRAPMADPRRPRPRVSPLERLLSGGQDDVEFSPYRDDDMRAPFPEDVAPEARPRRMPEDEVEFQPYHDDATVDFVPDDAAGRGQWPPDAEGYEARRALEGAVADPDLDAKLARDANERAGREYAEVAQLLREEPDAPDVRALAKQFGIEIPRTTADEMAERAARESALTTERAARESASNIEAIDRYAGMGDRGLNAEAIERHVGTPAARESLAAREAIERYANDPDLPAMQRQDAIERAVREREEVAQLLREEPDAPDVRALAKLFGLIEDEAPLQAAAEALDREFAERAAQTAKPKRGVRVPRGKKKILGDASGFAVEELKQAVAGGSLGALVGATQGEDAEGHVRYGLLGALLGAGGAVGGAKLLAREARIPGAVKPPTGTPGGAAEAIAATPEHITVGARGMPETAPGANLDALKQPPPVRTPTGTYGAKGGDHPILEVETPAKSIPRTKEMSAERRENWGLDSIPEEQRPFVAEILEEHAGFEDQRRGVQSHERTEALASRIKLSLKDTLAPGTTLPAAGQVAYARGMVAQAQKVKAMKALIDESGGTDEQLIEYAKLKSGLTVLTQSFFGTRGEAGRALNAHKIVKSLLPSEIRLVADMKARGRLRKDLYELSDVMANLPEDPVDLMNVLKNHQVRTKWQVVSDYYMSNILSGIKTQQRNLLGNTSKLASRVVEKAGTGGLDKLQSLLTGKERQVYSTEAMHEIQGGLAGLQKAFADATFTFKHGFSKNALQEGLSDIGTLHTPKVEFTGGLKNPLNIPGRALESADRFFRTLNGSMELHALSYAKARQMAEKQGLQGAAFNEFVSSRMSEMRRNPDKAMQQAIASTAERSVFQEKNAVANSVIGLKKQVPALNFVFPFVNTVANIFKQGVEHTPAGFFMARARSADPREAMIARGEAALGSLALMPVAYMAATGQISGSGPKDPAKRAALYESGWRPNSIRVGDDWYSYSFAQPLSVPLSLVANGFEAWEEVSQGATEKTKVETAEKMVAETIARVGKSALDQSFLSGLGDVVKALNDPEKAASGVVARILSGFVPLSGAARNVAQLIDPTVRAPEGIGESIATGIPFASQAVAPRLDRWGEEINRTRSSALNVLEGSDVNADPVADELTRLGLDVGLPSDRIAFDERISPQRPLTRDEAFGLRQTRGRSARTILHSVMQQPGYQGLPDVMKAQLLQRVMRNKLSNVTDVAKLAIEGGRPELLEQLSDPLEELAAATYARRP